MFGWGILKVTLQVSFFTLPTGPTQTSQTSLVELDRTVTVEDPDPVNRPNGRACIYIRRRKGVFLKPLNVLEAQEKTMEAQKKLVMGLFLFVVFVSESGVRAWTGEIHGRVVCDVCGDSSIGPEDHVLEGHPLSLLTMILYSLVWFLCWVLFLGLDCSWVGDYDVGYDKS